MGEKTSSKPRSSGRSPFSSARPPHSPSVGSNIGQPARGPERSEPFRPAARRSSEYVVAAMPEREAAVNRLLASNLEWASVHAGMICSGSRRLVSSDVWIGFKTIGGINSTWEWSIMAPGWVAVESHGNGTLHPLRLTVTYDVKTQSGGIVSLEMI